VKYEYHYRIKRITTLELIFFDNSRFFANSNFGSRETRRMLSKLKQKERDRSKEDLRDRNSTQQVLARIDMSDYDISIARLAA